MVSHNGNREIIEVIRNGQCFPSCSNTLELQNLWSERIEYFDEIDLNSFCSMLERLAVKDLLSNFELGCALLENKKFSGGLEKLILAAKNESEDAKKLLHQIFQTKGNLEIDYTNKRNFTLSLSLNEFEEARKKSGLLKFLLSTMSKPSS